jgi:hypothetical protein
MDIIRKDATITPVGADDDFPGKFEVILSAPTEDRDGDTLLPDQWKTPLPEHITFDTDHGMSVAATVGSGVPRIDEETGNLIVSGTYSSLPKAQEVRTLVNEGHIRTTSVAFMSVAGAKAAGGTKQRELLNGAFVAVPSNREALILSSKSVAEKAGARHSTQDKERLQQIRDTLSELLGEDDQKDARVKTRKSIAGSIEAIADRVRSALQDANEGSWIWIRGTLPGADGAGKVVFEVEDPDTYETQLYEQGYTDDGTTVTLTGSAAAVGVTEVVTAAPGEGSPDSTTTDGSTSAPAAGSPEPAAGAKSAPTDDDAARYRQQVRARALSSLASSSSSERN